MNHTHFVLDTVNLLAGAMARKLHFNTPMSSNRVRAELKANFARFDLEVSSEETRDLIGVFQADLTLARMQLIKEGVAQNNDLQELIDSADHPTATPET